MNPLKRLFQFVGNPSHSRTLGILAILVMVAAIPLTVYIAQQRQEVRQRAATDVETRTCQDLEVNQTIPPSTDLNASIYKWKADCTRTCNDVINNSDCSKNDFDPSNIPVDSVKSNWCYGFVNGPNCLKLVRKVCQTGAEEACREILSVTNLSVSPTPPVQASSGITITTAGIGSTIKVYISTSNNPTGGLAGNYDPNVDLATGKYYFVREVTIRSDPSPKQIPINAPAKGGKYYLLANAINIDSSSVCAFNGRKYNIAAGANKDIGSCQNPGPVSFDVTTGPSPSPTVTGDTCAVDNSLTVSIGGKDTANINDSLNFPLTASSTNDIKRVQIFAAEKNKSSAAGWGCSSGMVSGATGEWCKVYDADLPAGVKQINPTDSASGKNAYIIITKPGDYYITANIYSANGQCSGNPFVTFDSQGRYFPYPNDSDPIRKNYCYTKCQGNPLKNLKIASTNVTTSPTATATPTTPPGATATSTPPGTTATATPTPPSATQTPTPTPTLTPGGTQLAFELVLQGIGPNGGNQNPIKPKRQLRVQVFDINNQAVANKSGEISFDGSSQTFKGIVDLGVINNSNKFTVKVKTKRYLRKLIPGIQTLNRNTQNLMPITTLIVGDINDDNKLDIKDYNILVGCYSDKVNTSSCTDKENADLDDNGVIDGIDYNLFLRSLSVQEGD